MRQCRHKWNRGSCVQGAGPAETGKTCVSVTRASGRKITFSEWHPLHNLYYVSRLGFLERGPYLGVLFYFSIKTNLNWVLEAVLRWSMVVSERS